jgi:excisionase family DNA binding protein
MTKHDSQDLPSRLLTLDETRQILGCSMKTLRRRIADGAIATIRDGRLIRIHPDDLKRYIQQRRHG